MEYLAVVGISLFLLMPMIVIFYQQSGSLQDDINAAQIEKISLEIIDAAEEAYYLGPPTQKFLVVYLPAGVNNITVEEQELLFDYTTPNGKRIYSAGTDLPLNMTGSIRNHQGPHKISVRANNAGINVSDAS